MLALAAIALLAIAAMDAWLLRARSSRPRLGARDVGIAVFICAGLCALAWTHYQRAPIGAHERCVEGEPIPEVDLTSGHPDALVRRTGSMASELHETLATLQAGERIAFELDILRGPASVVRFAPATHIDWIRGGAGAEVLGDDTLVLRGAGVGRVRVSLPFDRERFGFGVPDLLEAPIGELDWVRHLRWR